MQCVRLVNGGVVDKLIVFDSLPKRFQDRMRTRDVAGLPRSWAKWLGEIGSMRPVVKTTTEITPARDYKFHYQTIGNEPCFFMLEYKMINADIDLWNEICAYVRKVVDSKVRLKEKIEDMAILMAPDCYKPLDIEPEDVMTRAFIPLPKETEEVKSDDEIVKQDEQIIVPEAKKRGRPKKVAVA